MVAGYVYMLKARSDTHIHSYCTSITESYLLDLIYTAGS